MSDREKELERLRATPGTPEHARAKVIAGWLGHSGKEREETAAEEADRRWREGAPERARARALAERGQRETARARVQPTSPVLKLIADWMRS